MWLTIAAVALSYIGWNVICLVRNLRLAKTTGLPYVVVPASDNKLIIQFLGGIIYNICSVILPKQFSGWMHFIRPMWYWKDKYELYRSLGSDIFIMVTPGRNIMYVADGAVAVDMMNRRFDFPKPIHSYKILELLGENVVTVEGVDHRRHRKVTSPPFSEKNNGLVWQESIYQTKSILSYWKEKTNNIVADAPRASMRTTLAIISYAGFGMRMELETEPEYNSETIPELPGHEETDELLPNGHKMAYQTALSVLLNHLVVLLVFPTNLLRYSPMKSHRTAVIAFDEWRQYGNELYKAKKAVIQAGSASKEEAGRSGDLMGALVKASDEQTDPKGSKSLTYDDIMGNTFMFIVAGHETTANTISFALLLLAAYPEYQKQVQAELDSILGGKSTDEWSYEKQFSPLAEGWIGAIMNETLRLYPPVPSIPKWTGQSAQSVVFEGRSISIPPRTEISIATVPLHRNPKYWLRPGQTEEEAKLLEFRPERWFREPTDISSRDEKESSFGEGSSAPQGKDTENNFYIPREGFLPFSAGMRACLGRRFAQVEFVAVLAVLFKEHNLELALEPGESWDDARGRAEKKLQNPVAKLTLQQQGEPIKLRWVPRSTGSS